jgi:hypothetical protein
MVGLSELIKLAVFADSAGVEVLDFVRESPDNDDLCCQMVGKRLAYSASVGSDGSLGLNVSNADGLDEQQHILRRVAPSGWQVIAKTIAALEYSGIASVAQRPLEVVDADGIKWVIA